MKDFVDRKTETKKSAANTKMYSFNQSTYSVLLAFQTEVKNSNSITEGDSGWGLAFGDQLLLN
jgi:hypothetical protein